MRRVLACLAVGLTLSACQASPEPSDPGGPDLPAGTGALSSDALLWAVGDTIHVDDERIETGQRVHAMVEANGRIYLLLGHSDEVRVTDGGMPRRTGFNADELKTSENGRFLGFLDKSPGMPWSTVVVDLESGEVVVRDDTGMGDADDDLSDLYEDAEPRALGFDGDEFFVRTASGSLMSWDPLAGERTDHGDQYLFTGRGADGKHVSPDGGVVLRQVRGGVVVLAADGGRRLPLDLPGRKFIMGGWTDDETAYGLAFNGRPYGPHRVRLVSCRVAIEQPQCRVLRTIRPPRNQLVLLPSGSAATDY